MNVVVSGSSGLIGKAVVSALTRAGHQIVPLRRVATTLTSGPTFWEPIRNNSWRSDIGPVDTVIHLAGENLAAQRWNAAVKRRLRDSRVVGTEQLCRHLAALEHKPGLLITASAVGYYGDRGDEVLTEDSSCGDGFLSTLCRDWEAACRPAANAGIRTVHLRLGMVLDRRGGALTRLIPVFKAGLGGRFGDGRQWMSWVTLDDLVACVIHTLGDPGLSGPVNVVAPNPVTNRDFTRILGRVVHRPAFWAVPSVILRAALGEMAGEMLLASARVEPKRLKERGFSFNFPDLESALRHAIFADN